MVTTGIIVALYWAIVAGVDLVNGELTFATGLISLLVVTIVSVVLVGIIAGIFWWRLPRMARKTFDQLQTVELPTEFRFDENQVVVSNSSGNSNLEYAIITDWLMDDRTIMLRRTPLLIYIMPRSQLDPMADAEVQRLLTSHGVKRG